MARSKKAAARAKAAAAKRAAKSEDSGAAAAAPADAEAEAPAATAASSVAPGKEEEEGGAAALSTGPSGDPDTGDAAVAKAKEYNSLIAAAQKQKEALRSTTGVLASHPLSRDLKIIQLNIQMGGVPLVEDQTLELNYGRRYGILGANGCGKSTLLEVIANREFEIPPHFDMFHLTREAEPEDRTAVEVIVDSVKKEAARLDVEADRVLQEEGPESPLLVDLYDRIDALEVDRADARAAELLHGLGFDARMQRMATKDFSGGWRMRVALAHALFIKPTILLLDEPTNHLDLEACVWLEEYLQTYDKILLLISHSQDFLNNVCTNILHMTQRKINSYTGNFDSYVKARRDLEENQQKRYEHEQEQIAHMKEYVARFGHGNAKLARQAQSKQKTLEKMQAAGLTEAVQKDAVLKLRFEECGTLTAPVIQFTHVSFVYNADDPEKKHVIYDDVDFGLDLESRLALVGPNGAGKSTLLKLMTDQLTPTTGMIRRHHHLKIAFFHQHLAEEMDEALTPLQFMIETFNLHTDIPKARTMIGRYGISGKAQTTPMALLSEGQKRRVAFSWVAHQKPHLMVLDEPTNHLDIETIDALAEALNNWDGGLVLVSHDFRLINQVAKEIWVCEDRKITPWKGSIAGYKNHLRKQMGLDPVEED